MDILLTHGYFIAEDAHEQKVMKPYPTLGILYISAYLKSVGFDVALFDSTFQDLSAFHEYVQERRPPVVGLYVNLMTKFNALKMISICQAVGAKIVLGGPEPAEYAGEYLARGADVVVVGEGEHTLRELLPHLAKHGASRLEAIQGIIFRTEDGDIIRNPARPYIKPLDALPFPDRESIDMDRYVDTWRTYHGAGSVSLICARGCPYHCKWCSHAVYGNTHRRRSPQNVADELEYLLGRYKPDQVWYADDVFTIHRRWFFEYAGLLKQRGIRIPFECISRADTMDESVADALAEMGCYRLWIGSESGSQRILDAMRRDVQVEEVQHMTRALKARSIQVGMFIMLGYEGEDISDLDATTAHLKAADPDTFLTTVAYPIKGTPYYNEMDSEDRVRANADWERRSDRNLSIAGRYSDRFYAHATRWMVNSVGLHKEWRHGPRNPLRMVKQLANSGMGRLGMLLTQHQTST